MTGGGLFVHKICGICSGMELLEPQTGQVRNDADVNIHHIRYILGGGLSAQRTAAKINFVAMGNTSIFCAAMNALEISPNRGSRGKQTVILSLDRLDYPMGQPHKNIAEAIFHDEGVALIVSAGIIRVLCIKLCCRRCGKLMENLVRIGLFVAQQPKPAIGAEACKPYQWGRET